MTQINMGSIFEVMGLPKAISHLYFEIIKAFKTSEISSLNKFSMKILKNIYFLIGSLV